MTTARSVFSLLAALALAFLVGRRYGEGPQAFVCLFVFVAVSSHSELVAWSRSRVSGPVRWSSVRRAAAQSLVAWLIFAVAYELLPWYHAGLLAPAQTAVRWLYSVCLLGAVPYSWWLHRLDARDHRVPWRVVIAGSLVKLVFLPLMWAVFLRVNHEVAITDWGLLARNGSLWVAGSLLLIGWADITIGAVGYALTSRLLGAHVRDVSTSIPEWIVTVGCYYPFWQFVYQYLQYAQGPEWSAHVRVGTWGYAVWASLVVFTHIGWLWATASHGHRFSNLTHRGVITDGLFRWFPHPAYTVKVVMFWVSVAPFLHGPAALPHTLGLGACTLIYWCRGHLEGRRLSADPQYREYRRQVRQRWRAAIARTSEALAERLRGDGGSIARS